MQTFGRILKQITRHQARRTCFISFIKLLFCIINKRKDETWSAFEYFYFFHETVNTTWRQPTTSFTLVTWFIAIWKHTCWLIKKKPHVLWKIFHNIFYYIDNFLLKNRQLVFSIRNYIRDTSEDYRWRHSFVFRLFFFSFETLIFM